MLSVGYKFLITYGQLFSVVKIICLGYGVIMAATDYIFIDVVIVVVLSWTMILCEPLDKLHKARPTSSLLGPLTLFSLVGAQVIHMFYLVVALLLMINHEDYLLWPIAGQSMDYYW